MIHVKQFIVLLLVSGLMVHVLFLYLSEREQRILLECQIYAPAGPEPTELFDVPGGV